MVVVLLFVGAFVLFRALNRDQKGAEPQTGCQCRPIEYQPLAANARADNKLQVFSPPQLPANWEATSATYDTQQNPHWHLGATNGKDYLGVEEGMDSLSAELSIALQGGWTSVGSVHAGAYQWAAYKDAHGNYAIAREFASKVPRFPEWLVVVGSASPQQVQEFAASLRD